MLINIFGWLGSLGYAVFSIPQMLHIVKRGHARDLSLSFLLLMWLGSLFSLIYVAKSKDAPLILNFAISLISATIMLRYKLFERK